MKKFIVFYIPFMFFPVNVFGQDDTTVTKADTIRTPVDTIYFSGYMAINFSVRASNEENWFENEWEVYLCDKKLLTSFRWYPGPGFVNFNRKAGGGGTPRLIQDINGDNRGEIIFEVYSGGNNGWESTYIYTLDTIATEIGLFDGLNQGLNMLNLQDIDGDGIPELISNDMNYGCWPEGCAGAPAPLLIWKWTGKQYRLANLKFSRYLLSLKGWKDEPNLHLDGFVRRPGYAAFPPIIADVMLEYIYAGKYSAADSAFNYLWPSNLSDKDKYYNEIWGYVKNSPFWQELQKSDW